MSAADGTIVTAAGIALIAFERRLAHPVDAVWAAITDPEQVAGWLGAGTIEARAGGRVALRTGPPESGIRGLISGEVLTWDPPRVFEHEWVQPGLAVSVVRYELEAEAGGTVLRLTHRRSASPVATGGRAGWHAFLDRLGAQLDGLPVPAWAHRRAEVQAAYGEAPIPRA
ncbi:MAG: SRPBCC family protein [Dehalococcoidia bacterium]